MPAENGNGRIQNECRKYEWYVGVRKDIEREGERGQQVFGRNSCEWEWAPQVTCPPLLSQATKGGSTGPRPLSFITTRPKPSHVRTCINF